MEDEPRDRSRILRQVWRTDELEEAGVLAGEARRETATLRIQLEQAASEYAEDPATHLERLRETLAAARRYWPRPHPRMSGRQPTPTRPCSRR